MSRQSHGTLGERIADRQPGVNRSGLIITDAEVAHFLGTAAIAMEAEGCADPHCEGCARARELWYEWYYSIHGVVRVALNRMMVECGIKLPTQPPLLD